MDTKYGHLRNPYGNDYNINDKISNLKKKINSIERNQETKSSTKKSV